MSMVEPNSRQHTPHGSPQPSPPGPQPGYEYDQLPASRSWDNNEVVALQLDMTKPPRCNLICFHHFCPDWAGEEEPDEMQESQFPRTSTE